MRIALGNLQLSVRKLHLTVPHRFKPTTPLMLYYYASAEDFLEKRLQFYRDHTPYMYNVHLADASPLATNANKNYLFVNRTLSLVTT